MMGIRWLVVTSLLVGCGADPSSTSATEGEVSSGSSGGEASGGGTSIGSAGSGTAATSTTTTASSSGSSGGGESSSGGIEDTCSNGHVDPGELCLLPGEFIEAGVMPVDLVVADLDRDGHLDLAIVDILDALVIRRYGRGDGTFDPAPALPGIFQPRAVAALSRDPAQERDLVSADQGTHLLALYRPDGRPRSYAAPVVAKGGELPRALVSGDLNDDGVDDLVVANEGSNDVSVILLGGDGEPLSSVAYPVGVEPYGLALGDLDGDGRLDLAVANRLDGTISVLLADGPGTFGPASTHDARPDPRSVVIGDFDGDGVADVAATSYKDDELTILRNLGDGAEFTAVFLVPGIGVYALAAGDLDADGSVDLVAVNRDSAEAVIIRHLSSGIPSFGALPVDAGPLDLALADLNGDGALDVVVVATAAGGVSLLLSDP